MKRMKVLVLAHEELVPPPDAVESDDADFNRYKTEFDVLKALKTLGHDARVLGVRDELRPIRDAINEWKPHIVFNLLDEFQGEAVYDQNVVSYLELLRVPYTGCNPRGLVLSRDKALSKKLVAYHRIGIPRFAVYRRNSRPQPPRQLHYPLIVKSLIEEASLGIARASVVRDDAKLLERVRFVHERVGTDAIVEEFIVGREIYVGILGNTRLQVLPPQELTIKKLPEDNVLIATEKVKHDPAYQLKYGVSIATPTDLPKSVTSKLERVSKRIYRLFEFEGYGRLDYRLGEDGRLYFLEANPNPEIARYDELALAAETAGMRYEDLIQKILNLGYRRR